MMGKIIFRNGCRMWYKKQFSLSFFRKRLTIFAISTSSGMSAVAIVRVSGPRAKLVPYRIAGLQDLPAPRTAFLRKFRDPQTKEILDKGLLLWFPSPNSFTGEDVCELHIHGGTAVKRTILQALSKLPSFCYAEPGEFTKRAFMAGKLDLTEVEGLADLLHAETEAQQRQALCQMEGSLFRLYSNWTHLIKRSLAKLEAYIDFSEDQHLENNLMDSVIEDVGSLREKIIIHLGDSRRGEKLRNGIRAVLIGKPNVGKSSLINAICERDVAIVSSSPGTTRDVVEKSINLSGYLVHLFDTAGIREVQDEVEREGVKRTFKTLSEADVLLFLVQAQTAVDTIQSPFVDNKNIIKALIEKELVHSCPLNLDLPHKINTIDSLVDENRIVLILNKIDLLSYIDKEVLAGEIGNNSNICAMSCLSGEGLREFLDKFSCTVATMCSAPSAEEPTITQVRHRKHVETCLECLNEFLNVQHLDVVIAAEQLRRAANQLGKITGKITTDDILDVIFKDFCIGK